MSISIIISSLMAPLARTALLVESGLNTAGDLYLKETAHTYRLHSAYGPCRQRWRRRATPWRVSPMNRYHIS
jgi:hypothetical protein